MTYVELTLKDRVLREQTLADISDHQGDTTGAEAARARARLLTRMMETGATPPP